MRVLVAEDDEVIRDVLLLALLDEGHVVRSAANGLDALALASPWHPDLILLDMMMPEMDGWTLLEHLRSQPETADIPVVVISASWRVRGQADTLGVETVIQKPFDLAQIVEVVTTIEARSATEPT